MLLKDISFHTPQENIFFDEVLLDLAERGLSGEALRFWESDQFFIVLGRISKGEDDLKLDAVRRDGIPVLRRSSGGGTVLQGKGCLNFSLVLSKESRPELSGIRQSYAFILGQVVRALKRFNVACRYFPISDIALTGSQKKISGNAQKRSRNFILHHGTLLYDFDLRKIEDYLEMPADIPPYRAGRPHLDFVDNIPLSANQLKEGLAKVFDPGPPELCLNEMEQDCLTSTLKTKCAT